MASAAAPRGLSAHRSIASEETIILSYGRPPDDDLTSMQAHIAHIHAQSRLQTWMRSKRARLPFLAT